MEQRRLELDASAAGTQSVNDRSSRLSQNGHAAGESHDMPQAAVDGVSIGESGVISDELKGLAVERSDVLDELDPGAAGTTSVNGHTSSVPRPRQAPTECHDLSEERPDLDGGPVGGSHAPPDEADEPAEEASGPSDHVGDSLAETDWETTRYLAAATQLDLSYARRVVRQIVGEPFRAVAPAAGADVVVVTRWALAALRRRAQWDAALTCLLVIGVAAALGVWTWIPIAAMAALAIFIVAYERWVRDVKIIDRLMLRGRFHANDAPSPPSPRIRKRLAVVQQQQKGNLVVFRGRSAFVGSGQSVVHNRVLINVERGKKRKAGKRQQPVPFSIPQLHTALETALKNMDFPEMRVGQRLFVNGEHVSADPRLLPYVLGAPVADAPAGLLYEGSVRPTSEARTYVCAEIGGWKGQLVVSLFSRAVQVRGSLQVEWTFHVLPPLHTNLLLIDRRYEPRRIKQIAKAMATGVLRFMPALILAPATFARSAVLPLTNKIRIRHQSYGIRNGYVFNYGSPRSIREDPISYRRPHDFVAGDELTFILLAQHIMLRALGNFLKAHKVDMKQFESQAKGITKRISNYNVDKIKAKNVAVGDKAHVGGSKSKPSASPET
jgi:hypothetical protein